MLQQQAKGPKSRDAVVPVLRSCYSILLIRVGRTAFAGFLRYRPPGLEGSRKRMLCAYQDGVMQVFASGNDRRSVWRVTRAAFDPTRRGSIIDSRVEQGLDR